MMASNGQPGVFDGREGALSGQEMAKLRSMMGRRRTAQYQEDKGYWGQDQEAEYRALVDKSGDPEGLRFISGGESLPEKPGAMGMIANWLSGY